MNLVRELSAILQRPLASIEILPGDIEQWVPSLDSSSARPLYLLVEGNFGIPQKQLYRAYLVAVSMLAAARTGGATSTANVDALVASTSVILLANPAHQTAMNTRKRLIELQEISLEQELIFSSALLSLRGCAKESTLWHHRRWLFERQMVGSRSIKNAHYAADSTPGFHIPVVEHISKEFALIRRACEIYPRNYHAWTHHGLLVGSISASIDILQRHQVTISDQSDGLYATYRQILNNEYMELRCWMDTHVSDHSAAHQLCNLARYLQVSSPSIVDHAMSLVTAYPSHEALWMYLRASASCTQHVGELAPIADRVRTMLDTPGTLSIGRNSDSVHSSQYLAKRFLNWWMKGGGGGHAFFDVLTDRY